MLGCSAGWQCCLKEGAWVGRGFPPLVEASHMNKPHLRWPPDVSAVISEGISTVKSPAISGHLWQTAVATTAISAVSAGRRGDTTGKRQANSRHTDPVQRHGDTSRPSPFSFAAP